MVKCSGPNTLGSIPIGYVTTQGLSFQTGNMGMMIIPKS